MNNLVSDQNTLVWLWFTLYAVTILLLVPNNTQSQNQLETIEANNEKALQFASKMILRTVLIIPMLFLIKNTI